MKFPTLEEYARAKGAANRNPRIVLPNLHGRMYREITRWAAGRLPDDKRNLAICIPPRHTKTMTARETVEWLMGMFPDSEWIYTSYGAQLAADQTMQIRETMLAPWYRRMFPETRIQPGRNRQDDIGTTAGGRVYSAGAGGPLTGFGAGKKRSEFGGAIIIDDPISTEDARSQTKRNTVNEWYTRTISRRKNNDKTPILLIMQRVHQEDLVGHVLKTEPHRWQILSLPAMDTATGKMLWPETFSYESAMQLKEVDPATFYAQYQQEPVIPGGAMIKMNWWGRFNQDETYRYDGLIFATADTAYKAKSTADASVIRVWQAKRKTLDCIDCVYGRWEFPELLQQAQGIYDRWKEKGLKYFFIEDKATGTPLEQTLRRNGVPAYGWNPADYDFPDNKVSRVQEAAWTIAAGYVRLPTEQSHAEILIQEAAQFMPDMSHAHDDHVDTATMAVSVWRHAGGGR